MRVSSGLAATVVAPRRLPFGIALQKFAVYVASYITGKRHVYATAARMIINVFAAYDNKCIRMSIVHSTLMFSPLMSIQCR